MTTHHNFQSLEQAEAFALVAGKTAESVSPPTLQPGEPKSWRVVVTDKEPNETSYDGWTAQEMWDNNG